VPETKKKAEQTLGQSPTGRYEAGGEHAHPAASSSKLSSHLQHYKEIKPAKLASLVCMGCMAAMML
ncbi:MAG: hypothetical protein ACRC6I_06245, partial [Paracoccaceae bacterium]